MSGPWMQTVSGRAVDLLAPSPEQIALDDIAHALSRQPRFNGHTQGHWSVAAHSILVAELIGARYPANDLRLAALLHDAHEAYMGDLISPMKAALTLMDLRARIAWMEIEGRLQAAIHRAFGLPADLPQDWRVAIHHADLQALEVERAVMMQPQPRPWVELPQPDVPVELYIDKDIDADGEFFAGTARALRDGRAPPRVYVREAAPCP